MTTPKSPARFVYRGFSYSVFSLPRSTIVSIDAQRHLQRYEQINKPNHAAAINKAQQFIDALITARRQAHRTRLQLLNQRLTKAELQSLALQVSFADLSPARQQGWAARLAAHAYASPNAAAWLPVLTKLAHALPTSTWQQLNQRAYLQNMLKLGKKPRLRALAGYRRARHTHCYACRRDIDNLTFYECTRCEWIICLCGACGCGFS